jgi:hypothetical protein
MWEYYDSNEGRWVGFSEAESQKIDHGVKNKKNVVLGT